MSAPRVFLVAAEASGDRLGADLMDALRARCGDLEFAGIGGALMAAKGVRSPFDIAELSVLGLIEGLKAYPRVVRRADEAASHAQAFDPDVAVLIDSWGFNLRVAQRLRRVCPRTKLVKYIGPQVWATRPGRARTLAATVDHLLCIHSFETPYYKPFGLPCTVVGNPIASAPTRQGDRTAFRARHGIAQDAPLLLILFGSRPAEIRRMAAPFIETAKRLRAENPNLICMTLAAPTVRASVEEALADLPGMVIVTDPLEKEDCFAACDVALACSGSVTTELALQGAPMVVGYRLGALSYAVLKRLFRPPYVTMFNIAADREIASEFIQERCTPERLAPALAALFADSAKRAAQIAAQNEALVVMGKGKPPAAEIAADAILQVLSAAQPRLSSGV